MRWLTRWVAALAVWAIVFAANSIALRAGEGDVERATQSNAATRPDFAPVAKVLEAAVADRAFPGCVVSVGTADGPLWTAAFGKLAYDGAAPATVETMYDLASLTKVVGTTSVTLCLIRDGKLKLADPLVKFVPEFAASATDAEKPARERVTIEHLLTHSTGLPAGRPLYKTCHSYREVIAEAAKTRLEAEPGAKMVYSDLGFILLGEAAARAGGKPLAELERSLLIEPLGLKSTMRTPPKSLWSRIAPTERIAGNNKTGGEGEFIRGVVHDENARAGEGLTGHAGLFSTANDVGRLAQEWLVAIGPASASGDEEKRGKVFPHDLAKTAITRRDLPPGSSRALGWDTPSGQSSSGSKMPKAFGHTGFTGTSVWVDPQRRLYVVLLSNRVHPTRANQKIAAVRRQFADAAADVFDRWAAGR